MSDVNVVQEDGPQYKGIWFFGTDLNKIECFRDSFLNGYIGAAVGSVIGYLYKNQARVAIHAAFASYTITLFSTWFSCRYTRYKRRKLFKDLKTNVQDEVEKSGNYNVPTVLKKDKKTMPENEQVN